MLRLVSEGLGLFLLPFAAYMLLLLAQRRYPLLRQSWASGSLVWLTAAGLGLAILGLLGLGLFSERYRGAYAPAHIENGRLVPGSMQ